MRSLAAALVLAALGTPDARSGEFPANRLYVCSQENDRVLTYDGSGQLVGAIGAATALTDPDGLAFGPDGLLYVVSSGDDNIHVFDPNPGGRTQTFGAAQGLVDPRGAAFGPDGLLYVGDGGSDSVFVFDRDGLLHGTLGAGAGIVDPSDLLFTADGHLFVASAGVGRVHEFDPSGQLVASLGEGTALLSAGGLALAPDGRLFVSSVTTDSVLVFDADGAVIDEIGGDILLSEPAGLSFGPHGQLVVMSSGNNLVLVFDGNGALVDSFGKSLRAGTDLAWSPFRFQATVRGKLHRDGEVPESVDQKGVLSIQPGSQLLMLSLEPATKGADLIDAFGTDTYLLPGNESGLGSSDGKRLFGGALVPDDAALGVASLSLRVGGKLDSQGLFTVKRAKGQLVRSGGEALFVGTANAGKRLK